MQRDRDWLKEAHAELQAALDLLRGGHWSWCCFTCQQVAEKVFGHNLNLLLQAVETYTAVPESVQMACARLNRYYIPTRYPNAFDRGAPADQFFESDASHALEDTEEVYRFAESVIGSP